VKVQTGLVVGARPALAVAAFEDEAAAQETAARLGQAPLTVTERTEKIVEEPPPPPYTTASLLEDATERLGWESEKVMRVAQALFEGIELAGQPVGLITYPRTDATRLAPEAVAEARAVIVRLHGREALPPARLVQLAAPGAPGSTPRGGWGRLLAWLGRKPAEAPAVQAQEAHEAIRPTSAERLPDSLTGALEADALALYRLIWQRLIASQMRPARYREIRVTFEEAER
jgi:DNA topoisomerase-1